MPAAVVKLKPDKAAPGPAVRLYRADDGFSFIVGNVDNKGTTDFRSESLHNSFDDAVKEAECRVKKCRVPLRNDTGVKIEDKKPTTAGASPPSKAPAPGSGRSVPTRHKRVDETPTVSSQFKLPSIDDRLGTMDIDPIIERAFAIFHGARDTYLTDHAQTYGHSRNHAVLYSQRLHDQIQAQLRSLHVAKPRLTYVLSFRCRFDI